MDKRNAGPRMDEYEASRPGLEMLAAAIIVGLGVMADRIWADSIWTALRSLFDFV